MALFTPSESPAVVKWQLKESPKHEHLTQLQIYLNLRGYKYGVVVYENKNDQKLKAFKVNVDKDMWETILDRCKSIMEMEEAPSICTGMWYCKCKGTK